MKNKLRAQVSLELLFSFLISLGVITTIFFVLLNFYEKLKKDDQIIKETVIAEQIARTLDTLASSGNYKIININYISQDEGELNVNYRIENSIISIDYNGKSIIANTIFNEDEINAQQI